ncbi:STAS domain-containing protein [Streptacidiphilus sp. PB12-B1b]|uniref:STAS domain-containing protein n=1 Tax=Streptacidiphilus sp. PB12-B1b TaxID=2705012 RepID=UPI0015F9FA04|nr:STAS domain-containing protein [Streptacidiphilus sp. PB12-B1b]QMU76828.1 STAS domain-containing protein [Streptacidiphilus sp. PB12-B1b]
MTTPLTLTTVRRADGSHVLEAAGEIDMSNVESFAAAIDEATASATALTVDLSAVEYLDSAGLTVLFARAERIELVANPLLGPLLDISGLSGLTRIHGLGPGAGEQQG